MQFLTGKTIYSNTGKDGLGELLNLPKRPSLPGSKNLDFPKRPRRVTAMRAEGLRIGQKAHVGTSNSHPQSAGREETELLI